ncbi:hypothetical protein C8R44DRAFT_394564 [Mycena epipterygia]|nr:hypothetical protein C8R44DRAFT_394564 [Mycena epipterygia]
MASFLTRSVEPGLSASSAFRTPFCHFIRIPYSVSPRHWPGRALPSRRPPLDVAPAMISNPSSQMWISTQQARARRSLTSRARALRVSRFESAVVHRGGPRCGLCAQEDERRAGRQRGRVTCGPTSDAQDHDKVSGQPSLFALRPAATALAGGRGGVFRRREVYACVGTTLCFCSAELAPASSLIPPASESVDGFRAGWICLCSGWTCSRPTSACVPPAERPPTPPRCVLRPVCVMRPASCARRPAPASSVLRLCARDFGGYGQRQDEMCMGADDGGPGRLAWAHGYRRIQRGGRSGRVLSGGQGKRGRADRRGWR